MKIGARDLCLGKAGKGNYGEGRRKGAEGRATRSIAVSFAVVYPTAKTTNSDGVDEVPYTY